MYYQNIKILIKLFFGGNQPEIVNLIILFQIFSFMQINQKCQY